MTAPQQTAPQQNGPIDRRKFLAASSAAFAAGATSSALADTGTRKTKNTNMEKLAIDGGPKAAAGMPSLPIRWGEPESERLDSMLKQRSLLYWNGPQTGKFIEDFQKLTSLKYAMTCSSGTAALHIAVAAAGIGPGDEVITSSVTDIGTVIGVIYQQGVPVFADLLPATYNLDPKSVEAAITPKTKAIIAVHLFGNPCDLDALKAIADKHDLILIEDCAQAWGAQYRGRPIGSVGHIACWSLQDSKLITCGDGGVVASNDDRFGPLLQPFGDKGFRRGSQPGVVGFSTNYRMSEPQAAVASAQIERLEPIAAKRSELGNLFNERIAEIPGVVPHKVDQHDRCVYWYTYFRLEDGAFRRDRDQFIKALRAEGVPAYGGYIAVPIYQMPIFQQHGFFAGRWPVRECGLTDMDYRKTSCPESEALLATGIRLNPHQGMTDREVESMAQAMAKVASHYAT